MGGKMRRCLQEDGTSCQGQIRQTESLPEECRSLPQEGSRLQEGLPEGCASIPRPCRSEAQRLQILPFSHPPQERLGPQVQRRQERISWDAETGEAQDAG